MIQPWRWLRTTTTTNAVTLGLVLSAGVMGCRSASEVIHQPALAPVETSMVSALPVPADPDDPSSPFFVAPAPPENPAYDEGTAETSTDTNNVKLNNVDPKTAGSSSAAGVEPKDLKNEDPIEPLIADANDKSDATNEDKTDNRVALNSVKPIEPPDTSSQESDTNIAKDDKNTAVVPEISSIEKVEAPKTAIDPPKATDVKASPLQTEPETVVAPQPKAIDPKSESTDPGATGPKVPVIESTEPKLPTTPLFPTEAPKVETPKVETPQVEAPKIELPEVGSNTEQPTKQEKTPNVEKPVAPEFPLIELPTIEPADSKNADKAEVAADNGNKNPDQEFAKVDVPEIKNVPAEQPEIDVFAPELVATIKGDVHRLVVSDGEIFVSHSDGISVVGRDKKVTEFSSIGAPRGLIVSKTGAIVCDAEKRAVVRLNNTGSFAELIGSKSDGYFLRSPNSIVADNKGGYYFSDPGYARIRNAIGKVHYIDAAGKVTLAARKLAFPEGVTISKDGGHLLVVESQENQLASFQILSPGKLGPKKIFAKLPKKQAGDKDDFASGLCIDANGNVYVAHHGMQQVEVISSKGEWLQSIKLSGVTITDVAVLESGEQTILAVTGQSQGKKNGQIWRLPVDMNN